ncbi:uncharacterized protein LOC130549373 [Triplophysa rosa]|uniref:uncharacterized protein LOC130549373 n=1 Tax=Triplophysa rosa TaxID=992332 RepID=UPI002545D5D2|nr:uncharacterized protein LOC130549373 [Triplophysa rosa]
MVEEPSPRGVSRCCGVRQRGQGMSANGCPGRWCWSKYASAGTKSSLPCAVCLGRSGVAAIRKGVERSAPLAVGRSLLPSARKGRSRKRGTCYWLPQLEEPPPAARTLGPRCRAPLSRWDGPGGSGGVSPACRGPEPAAVRRKREEHPAALSRKSHRRPPGGGGGASRPLSVQYHRMAPRGTASRLAEDRATACRGTGPNFFFLFPFSPLSPLSFLVLPSPFSRLICPYPQVLGPLRLAPRGGVSTVLWVLPGL